MKLLLLSVLALLATPAFAAPPTPVDPAAKISPPETDSARHTQRFTIESPYLSGKNVLEVLLPDKFDAKKHYRVLYVLPVDLGIGGRWGDALMEVRKQNLHNTYDLICVYPAFDTTPWFNDNPANPKIRHETYITNVVIPFIDKTYPTLAKPESRLLLGFSKSGFGAWTLLMRHPDLFGYAAAWDSPIMMTTEELGKYGTKPQFGTPEVFAKYLPRDLVKAHVKDLQPKSRLVLAGSDAFGKETQGMHDLLESLKIPHTYLPNIKVKHHWESGWVKSVADELMKLPSAAAATKPAD